MAMVQWPRYARLALAAILGLAVLLADSTPAGAAASCGPLPDAAVEWPTSSPEEAGIDPGILCPLGEALPASPEMNIHAVVVVRNGRLVYEFYGSGEDNRWGEPIGRTQFTAGTLHDVRSISKSVVSLLVGIAIDRQQISGIDTPIFSYFATFGELRTAGKDRITLGHLLTMTSGLAWDESDYDRADNSFNEMLGATDPYRFVLERPLQAEPGTRWNYSGGDTQLLAGVLQRSTGRWLIEFARSELFEPLGIKQFEWAKMAANGEAAAGSGLRLRPRDIAKIGQLVLNRGRWNDHQIVPENWIEVSTRTHISGIDPNVKTLGYGYQWWTYERENAENRDSIVIALGYGGQRIYIVPSLGLVVAITAGLYDSKSQDWVSYDLFDKYVLQAISVR